MFQAPRLLIASPVLLLAAASMVSAGVSAGAKAPDPAGLELFERKIRPLLTKNCYSCHSKASGQALGGFRLDTREGLLKGGISGSALVAGKPDQSRLILAVRYKDATLRMPPNAKLSESDVADLEKWVSLGAPDPRSGDAPVKAVSSWDEALRTRRDWWSLKPLKYRVPPVKAGTPAAHPVDRFLAARLAAEGLKPAPVSDRRSLIRRLTLLLTGLPPKPSDIDAFLSDTSPRAYERVVDRLLDSPQFGERWARHWMDVVRYGETHGYEWNYELRDPWRYRDYLIRAFNQDVKFDRFISEHIAGDVLPQPRINTQEKLNESVLGTAFFRFGEVGHDDFKEIGYDVIDNQIDTLSKAFQAATVSCARCHDHKLDAVSQKDYYALFGILTSARQIIQTIDTPEAHAEIIGKLKTSKGELRRELAKVWSLDLSAGFKSLTGDGAGSDPSEQAWRKALDGASSVTDPLWLLKKSTAGEFAPAWKSARTELEREARERAEFNAKNFVPFGDFRQGLDPRWLATGVGAATGASPAGEFIVAGDGDKAVTAVLPAGVYTHAYSERLNGGLRSPFIPKEHRFMSVLAVGGKGASFRTVPDFRQLGAGKADLKDERPKWTRLVRQERYDQVYGEVISKVDNPNWPERGRKREEARKEDTRSYFGIVRAVVHSIGQEPKDEIPFASLLTGGSDPGDRAALADRMAAVFSEAVKAWGDGRATDAQANLVDWLLQKGLIRNTVSATPELQAQVQSYRSLEQTVPQPRLAPGVADMEDCADFPILLRGDHRTPGDTVPRRYLEVLSSDTGPMTQRGSGRLELAGRIADPGNPLTGRTITNRVWYWLFGTGIVRTVDDFGHMGESPSHPELLDWLAATFVEPTSSRKTGVPGLGWSLKGLIRMLVKTEAFKRSSAASAESRASDPENRLLQHFPARRLEAEGIRDAVLATSGRLDLTMFGPGIDPFREKPNPDRRLLSGPLDGDGRRSIYTRVTLMEGDRFLGDFNFPDPKVAQGRREITNVPAQALTMLNDPFIHSQAETWAKSLVTNTGETVEARVDRMFRAAVGRGARPDETARFVKLVETLARLHSTTGPETLGKVEVWKDIAHTVFNLKEFLYIP